MTKPSAGKSLPEEPRQRWMQLATGAGLLDAAALQQARGRALCYAILLQEGAGVLGRVGVESRNGAIGCLKNWQDQASGLFTARPPDGKGELHAAAYREAQLVDSYLALHALNALGAQAAYPLHFMANFEPETDLGAWPMEVDEPAARALLPFFLIYRAEVEGLEEAFISLQQTLDWLEQTQEPVSGLWGAGAAHWSLSSLLVSGVLLPYFEYVYRPISRVTRLIDATLEARQDDGSLIGVGGEKPGVDLALITLLATLSRNGSYRQDEVQLALRASHKAIGRLAESIGEEASDLLAKQAAMAEACYAYLTALGAIGAVSGAAEARESWRQRCWPAPGYYRPFDALGQQDLDTLVRWQRRLPEVRQGAADEPRVSVIVPCFNLGRYLYEALASVLTQTTQALEIVIVDDGSDDPFTGFILSRIQHPAIRVYRRSNQGVAAARNFGIRQARCDYLCCLDPDDRLRPGFLQDAQEILEKRPDVGFVTGHMQFFDERNDVLRYEDCAFPGLLAENRVVEPAVFRRAAWEKAGGYRSFGDNGIEDWDLWISILEQGYKAEVIQAIVWDYRIRAEQMSEKMFQPPVWGALHRELVQAHEATYRRYLADVVAIQAARWSELRLWTLERERAQNWWMKQANAWEQTAKEQASYIEELRGWIAHLEQEEEGSSPEGDNVSWGAESVDGAHSRQPWRSLRRLLRWDSKKRDD